MPSTEEASSLFAMNWRISSESSDETSLNWNKTRNFTRYFFMYIDVFRRNCHIFKLRCTNCFRVSLCFNIKLNLSHLLWNIISLKRDLFGFNSQTRHTLSNFPVYSRVMGVFISLISVVMLFFDSLIFFFCGHCYAITNLANFIWKILDELGSSENHE